MIEFYSHWTNLASKSHKSLHPYKVSSDIPNWWKNMPKWMPEEFSNSIFQFGANKVQGIDMTLKACPAVQDLFKMGNSYIIPAWSDFGWAVTRNEDGVVGIQFNPPESSHWFQTDIHPEGQHHMAGKGSPMTQSSPAGLPSIKFISPWCFKTPPGTSTLFLHPLEWYEDKLPFRILPGLVHTDVWREVNFPAVWYSGDVPTGWVQAGTPMIQAIVFYREEFDLKINYIPEDEYWPWLHQYQFKGTFSTRYKERRRNLVKWSENRKKGLTLIHKLLKFLGVYRLFKSKDKCPVNH